MSVQISGESGTGKEVMARFIHRQSRRSSGPFVKVDCPALSGDLLGSELFGHVKGSFTGASGTRQGRFEAAAGGTLFLDEISEISMEQQKKLLRFLQSRAFERVGENRTRRVDVRIVAATNRDLSEEVAVGRFREDLFWRLSAFPIHVPPLRERQEEVLLLARHFLERHWREVSKVPELSEDTERLLTGYHWPGNCRELENMMWYATSMVDCGEVVRPEHLPPSIERIHRNEAPPGELLEALNEAKWNRAKAAEILGISRVTLWRRMKRLGILDDK
jgi:transcriptional regulator with GAF, ATPase, and Fis domain